MLEVEGRSRAAALKGSMTYAFTHVGNFLLLLLAIEITVFRRRFTLRTIKNETAVL